MAFRNRLNLPVICAASLLWWSCNTGLTTKNQDTASKTDSITSSPLPEAPVPDDFIKDLQSMATDIVVVQLIKVDSTYESIKIFNGIIIKAYKGDLKPGAKISYAGMSEKNYGQHPADTLVAFLKQSSKPLNTFKNVKIYYSTVEENAAIKYSNDIDSLLKKQ